MLAHRLLRVPSSAHAGVLSIHMWGGHQTEEVIIIMCICQVSSRYNAGCHCISKALLGTSKVYDANQIGVEILLGR